MDDSMEEKQARRRIEPTISDGKRYRRAARRAWAGWRAAIVTCVIAGATDAGAGSAEAIWGRIGPLFTPPPQYANDYGAYRSMLTFDDGTPVRTPADWQRRRQEILDRWHELLGAWPPVIEHPKVEILETTTRENFVQQRVGCAWVPGQLTEGYLLVPPGEGARPAVLAVYYDPETSAGIPGPDGRSRPLRDFAYQLTRRGFVTLSIGPSAALAAKTYSIYYPDKDNARLQPLSALACAAANAYHVLAERSEVDPRRVGVLGHSFGGKWAMFASCLYDKFACAAWSDGGIVFDNANPSVNYWEPWYLGYQPGPWRKRGLITAANPAAGLYPRLMAEGRDLHELHALMAPRPFLVSGGAVDTPRQWRALNRTIQVNELLGCRNRVAMSNRDGHSPTPESNEQIYLFFEHFLKRDPSTDQGPEHGTP